MFSSDSDKLDDSDVMCCLFSFLWVGLHLWEIKCAFVIRPSHTSPTEAQVARKQSPKPGGGISTKGGKHEHTHTPPGVNRDMCVYMAFYLAEGHQWVILLKSALGYWSRWHTRSGCLRTRLTGQCLMPHNWFYWPAQPAGCQCWFEARPLRLTTTAVLPGFVKYVIHLLSQV